MKIEMNDWLNSQLLNSKDHLTDATNLLNQIQLSVSSLTVELSNTTQNSIQELKHGYLSIQECKNTVKELHSLIKVSKEYESLPAFQELILLDQVYLLFKHYRFCIEWS
jgi:hypothetical protein